MSALEESSLDKPVETLGIIAGGGKLPRRLLQACDAQGIHPFVVAFKGQTDPETYDGREHIISRLGAAGGIIKSLKAHNAMDLVLIGSLKRPHLPDLRPDLFTAGFFARLGMRALGDNDLLSSVRAELEKEGFTLHGVHKFVKDLLAEEGALGKISPSKKQWVDIDRGIEVSQALGRMDVGQSAIVYDGHVLGVEGAEGTDELIRRCAAYKKGKKGGVLVKTCKPQQDLDLDLPTIGSNTLELCAQARMDGIAVHAGHTLIADPEETAQAADKQKMFVIGVQVDDR